MPVNISLRIVQLDQLKTNFFNDTNRERERENKRSGNDSFLTYILHANNNMGCTASKSAHDGPVVGTATGNGKEVINLPTAQPSNGMFPIVSMFVDGLQCCLCVSLDYHILSGE